MRSTTESVPLGAAGDLRGFDVVMGSKAPIAAFFPIKKDKPRNSDVDFVYIMINNRNGYYKIGKSKNPRYRECTLQAEDPDITLVAAVRCAPTTERDLHIHFKASRIRGEWFSLSLEQVDYVLKMLKENKSREKI